MELIPGLPEELGLECLTRSHYTTHRVASRVSRQWRELLQSREFYCQRKQSGYTRKMACLVQSIPATVPAAETPKSVNSLSYGITLFDTVSQTWERLSPIPKYPNGLPLFCQLAGCEGKLIVMGGWDPVSFNPVKDVFVYDFITRQWRQGMEMPSKRSFFAMGTVEGHVYVAGGHDENKNALKSAWAYDVRQDHWTELTPMSQGRDECEGVVVGDEFWVVSGYETNRQGMFESSVESYRVSTGVWKRVEEAWKAGHCPRSCVGVGKDGKLVSWAESGLAVRVGAYGVGSGGDNLFTGSGCNGAPKGFFMVEMNGKQNGKLEEIEHVPDEFCGFVQSGCSLDI